jgi:alkylmercury lyase-like protein
MDFNTQVKLAVYRHFASTGKAPTAPAIAEELETPPNKIIEAYRQLRASRVLLLEADGQTIRMAPPWSGVPTQHRVRVAAVDYFANCAWDALGIPAALHQPGTVYSRCEQSREPLQLEVALDGPGESSWLFHSLVPAAHWWQDLVFT